MAANEVLMEIHDVQAALSDLPELAITTSTTEEEAAAAMRMFTPFNQCMVGVTHFSGLTPWERHSDDELLYVIEGEVDVTILTDAGPIDRTLREGSVFVVPRGHWHRQLPRPAVKLMFVTGETDVSTAKDPRRES